MKATPVENVEYYLKEARKIVTKEWESTTIFTSSTDIGRVWIEIAKMIREEEQNEKHKH